MQSGKTLKLKGWTPQSPPEENSETKAYRRLIVEAVNLLYDVEKAKTVAPFQPKPVSLAMIYTAVKNRVTALMLRDQWPHFGYFTKVGEAVIHTKRWVDRRVNEVASKQYGGQIVAARAGFYLPNHMKEIADAETG